MMPQSDQQRRLWRTCDVARSLDMHSPTVRCWAKAGRVPRLPMGSPWCPEGEPRVVRFDPCATRAWVQATSTAGAGRRP